MVSKFCLLSGFNWQPWVFRNPAWENFDAQKRKVIAFSNMWKEYDWTKKLQKKKEDDSSSSSSSEDDENE